MQGSRQMLVVIGWATGPRVSDVLSGVRQGEIRPTHQSKAMRVAIVSLLLGMD